MDNIINEAKFEALKDQCPGRSGFARRDGKPGCIIPVKGSTSINSRKCDSKSCPIFFWVKNLSDISAGHKHV